MLNMKKIIVCVVSVSVLLPSFAFAQTACQPGDEFNIFTGASCSQTHTPCQTGDVYNIQTGALCSAPTVIVPQIPVPVNSDDYELQVFMSAVQTMDSTCNNAAAGTAVTSCEQAESQLLPILDQEQLTGISTQDATKELSLIESEYATLQLGYYTNPGGVPESYYEGTRNNIAAEMQILASDEVMFR